MELGDSRKTIVKENYVTMNPIPTSQQGLFPFRNAHTKIIVWFDKRAIFMKMTAKNIYLKHFDKEFVSRKVFHNIHSTTRG